jgi:predicted TPR repeat methyltransferase
MLETLLQEAFYAHQQGHLNQAKQLYERILEKEPIHAETLHLLGLVAAQQGQLEPAVTWIKRALSIKQEAVFYNNLGNVFKRLKQWDEAIHHYQEAFRLNPTYAEAYNNLGNLFYTQNKLHESLQYYIKAVQLQPDYLEAQVNLGLLFLKQEAWDKAIKQFKKAIALEPHLPIAYWQLGNLYLQQDNLEEALQAYQALLTLQPTHLDALNNIGVIFIKREQYEAASNYFQKVLDINLEYKDARNNLAALLLQQNRFTEAAWHYQFYLQLEPCDSEAHYNFAIAILAIGNVDEAITHFKQTLALSPHHVDAYCNLGAIYLRKGKKEEALEYYKNAFALQPNNKAVEYMLSALTGKNAPSAAPTDYLKNLFDNYANYFDKQLTESLHYQIPSLMRKMINAAFPEIVVDTLLDLGCGTGLSGTAFRTIAKHMIGVDISPKMIEKAQEKGIYDELIKSDILSILCQHTVTYDLIIAADTFVYSGDLSQIFVNIRKRLNANGLCCFSIEKGKQAPYQLQTTGRYTHTADYIQRLALQSHFTILGQQQVTGRLQQGEEVESSLFLLQCKN